MKSISSVLTVIFTVAKLMGVIDWSWWVVFSPIIASVSLAMIFIIGGLIYGFKNKLF